MGTIVEGEKDGGGECDRGGYSHCRVLIFWTKGMKRKGTAVVVLKGSPAISWA